MKGKRRGKTNCETQDELQGQSYYIHYHRAYVKQCTICTLGGKYKIEKVSFLRIDANLTSIAKTYLTGCVKV